VTAPFWPAWNVILRTASGSVAAEVTWNAAEALPLIPAAALNASARTVHVPGAIAVTIDPPATTHTGGVPGFGTV
jgi:hypothetical protein